MEHLEHLKMQTHLLLFLIQIKNFVDKKLISCVLNNQNITILNNQNITILSPLYLPYQLFYLRESKEILSIEVNYIVVKNNLLLLSVVMHTSLSKGYQT